MGPLVIIPKGGTITAERYKETLQKHFILFYNKIKRIYGSSVVMQEDNAPQHTAKVIRAFCKSKRVKQLQWPPQSPDLLPIENLWKQIKDMISKRRHRIKNIAQMEDALVEVWQLIRPASLLKLNASMPARIKAVIKAKGGHTKYQEQLQFDLFRKLFGFKSSELYRFEVVVGNSARDEHFLEPIVQDRITFDSDTINATYKFLIKSKTIKT